MSKNPVYISPAKKAWITRKVKGGATKYQTAKELHLATATVYRWTKDIPSRNIGWPGIRGKTITVLQELFSKGYSFPTLSCAQRQYFRLNKLFPTIRRIKIYNYQILYLEGREEEAARAFLVRLNKKIIGYNELKQITKVFGATLSQEEKDSFLFKNRRKNKAKKNGVPKEGSLPMEDDSFSFFYIRRYWGFRWKEGVSILFEGGVVRIVVWLMSRSLEELRSACRWNCFFLVLFYTNIRYIREMRHIISGRRK